MQHQIPVPVEALAHLLLRAAHASRLLSFIDDQITNLAATSATEHVDHIGRVLAKVLGVAHGFGNEPTVQRALTPARGIHGANIEPTDSGAR